MQYKALYLRRTLMSSLVLVSVVSCKTEEKLPKLGDKLAGPVDAVASPSANYFYVLNSDFERRFDQGSLIVIDPEAAEGAQKLAAIPTERMGRSLHVAQNLLLVTYDVFQDGQYRLVELWDLQNETSPQLAWKGALGCSPINGVIAKQKPYFAVSCSNGDLYLGAINSSNLAASTLSYVRNYGYAHRALYFYEGQAATYLLGFPTDVESPNLDDFSATDAKTYDRTTDKVQDGADEIPDSFQETVDARRRPAAGYPYQMFLYNVTQEETESKSQQDNSSPFRFIALGTYAKPSQANQEMLFVNYTLREQDGTPSSTEGSLDLYTRAYHTNFWMAQAGLGASDQFYLSQRGNAYGSPANNILRLTIDPAQIGSSKAKFSQIFRVERVYGFLADRDNTARFPGAFAVARVDDEPMLLINHFRDLINFREAPFYSISRKYLNQPFASEQAQSYDSTDFQSSFYQIAVSTKGKVLSCSYYGNALYLFDARPRTTMSSQTPVRIE